MKQIVNSKFYEITMVVLVVLSILIMTIQSITEVELIYGPILNILDILIASIFIIDYGLQIITSKNKLHYIFSLRGIIDIISVIPTFIPFTLIDLRALRLLRSLRIFRIFKLTRYSRALDMLSRVFKKEKEILITTIFIALSLVLCAAVVVYGIENPVQPEVFSNIPQSIWWAIATMTTVGYGDIYPITALGKIIASLLVLIGIGIIAVPSGIISAGFLSELQDEKTNPEYNKKTP